MLITLFLDKSCVNIIEAIRFEVVQIWLGDFVAYFSVDNFSVCPMGQVQGTTVTLIYLFRQPVEVLFSPHRK